MCVYRFYYMQFGNEPSAIRDAMVIGVSNSNFWPKLLLCLVQIYWSIPCVKVAHKTDMQHGKLKKLCVFFESPLQKDQKKKIEMQVIKT